MDTADCCQVNSEETDQDPEGFLDHLSTPGYSEILQFVVRDILVKGSNEPWFQGKGIILKQEVAYVSSTLSQWLRSG